MNEILEIRLQGPARTNLVLVDSRHQRLRTPQRLVGSRQLLEIQIECACTRRDMGISAGNAELVLGPPVTQTDEFDAAVGVAVDEISIRRTEGNAREYANSPVIVI